MIKALPAIKPEIVIDQAVEQIRTTLNTNQVSSVVISLGGGVDSATALTLLTRAVPLDKITVILLPGLHTLEEDMQRAEIMPLRLGIPETQIIEINLAAIEQALDTTYRLYEPLPLTPFRTQTLLDEVRFAMIRELAKTRSSLAISSHHKTDRLLRLDHAQQSLFSPLAELYKTQVFALAGYLGVVEDILSQTPTPLLDIKGDQLSFSAIEADPLLWALTEDGQSKQALLNDGCDETLLAAVIAQAQVLR